MKIVLFEHSNRPYPVIGYGGAERVNQLLFKSLVDYGYDVTLVVNDATKFEYGTGKVIQVPFSTITNILTGKIPINNIVNGDIFHSHTSGANQSFDFNGFKGHWVATCHGSYESIGCPNMVFLSMWHYRFHSERAKPFNKAFLIYNGVDQNELSLFHKPRTYLAWIGNIIPDKGPSYAVRVAMANGEHLKIAGPIGHEEYYQKLIKPFLGKNIEYIGIIKSEQEKSEFFAGAKAYLHTTLKTEPCAVSMLEAQMCGVPALSFEVGCAREINFSSNLVFRDEQALSRGIKNQAWSSIDRDELRAWTIENFGRKTMMEGYLDTWHKVLI